MDYFSRRYSLVIIALLVALGSAAVAAERTTPVTVRNLLGIDPNNNTVKAEQSGLWSVSISNTPTVNVNTHAVTQGGTWNVGINNIPNVSVTNSPAVKIDTTDNTVKTPTQSKTVQFWSTDRTLPANSSFNAGTFSCAGYKELRVVIRATSAPDMSKLRTYVYFLSPTGASTSVGSADFATATTPLTSQGNFTAKYGTCTFCIPVMSDTVNFWIGNTLLTGDAAVLDHAQSWIYLVN